jgi:cystathionine beta-synthase
VQYVNSLLDLIGNTPLVRLSRTLDLPADDAGDGADGPLVLAKVEYLNPGGSVKDRIASRMIEAAEASGELKPGGTIVEPTSGNTGVGLAMVAQQKGYTCIFVCPDKVSEDKRNVLKAYGAEVVVCPTAVAPEHPDSYYNVSDRLASQPGAWKPDQYSNPHNPRSHYETTGPEIWEQTDGKITHFVTGMGTGGTISGVGRYLKERAAERGGPDIQVIGADPAGSVYSGGTGRPYLVEGVGEDFWPETYDRGVADRVIEVSDADSFAFTRRLAREEAMLVGGSAGMAAFAARQVAHELAAEGRTDAVVVVLLPDSGRGYLTKVFNDDWLAQYGFATGAQADHRTVGEVLRGKSGQLPDLVHTHPGETIAEAVHILQEYGVSQMPVVRAEPPIVAAEVAGSVSERTLLDALFAGHAKLTDQVEDHMSEALPTIGSTEAAADAVSLLEHADAVLVQEDGKPIGVLTRQDLLTFVAAS